MTKPTILTGLRANNDLTIGNYFGAILPIVDMAKARSHDFTINLFIPDLHSFTTPVDHNELFNQVLHNARIYLAAGLPIDDKNVFMYRQSYIPAHSELTWILDCFTGFGEMSRMTQFKEKSAKLNDDRISVGLFNYPILMAADILLYNAVYVPVGDDQTQHLEFARDIAERMNNQFGELFIVPEPVARQHQFFGKDQGLRIRDLVDPSKKMSKSDDSDKGVIFLGDNPDTAAKKVMSATTDDFAEIRYDKERQPGISNLLEILALLRGVELDEVVGEFEGQTQYGTFKAVVADEVKQFLMDLQTRLASVSNEEIYRHLEASEKTVAVVANATLLKAQQAVGLRPKG
ncbi:MAG TPA: tryptophan--tRNA ligase [Candidatus Saccharibacteria bacterium]|nr:tryptophan--tRNA ligase [Candidatus Saccharibacteria bacterium]